MSLYVLSYFIQSVILQCLCALILDCIAQPGPFSGFHPSVNNKVDIIAHIILKNIRSVILYLLLSFVKQPGPHPNSYPFVEQLELPLTVTPILL